MADPQWKKNLRPASFRGIPFLVESHTLSGGRRGIQHEFAQRNDPFTEDTGRKGRKYSVEAYLVGADYMPNRDKLTDAAEADGAGELIHPYFGRKIVNCFDFSVMETTREGGFVKFTFSFVESGTELFPDSKVDALSATSAAADSLVAAKYKEFTQTFSVAQQPQFILDSAASKIRDTSSALETMQDHSGGILASSAAAAAEIQVLRGQADVLIGTPGALFDQVENSFSVIFDAVTNKRSGFEAGGGLVTYGNGDAPIVGDTATRDQQRTNQEQINSSVRILALSEAAVAAVQIPFESTNDATAVRQFMLDAIDNESDVTTSDEIYAALRDLKVQMVTHIPGDAANLAIVSSVVPKETSTSLTIAYEVYGSVEKELDIVARNNLRTPGFIAAGKAVEVLLTEEG